MTTVLQNSFYFEHFQENDGSIRQVPLQRLPFRVGRGTAADYVIHSKEVSKAHAELFLENGQLLIRDLDSTNGTFVNGAAVKQAALRDGDIIHLADKELRIVFGKIEVSSEKSTRVKSRIKSNNIHYQDILKQVFRDKTVRALFQPIVTLESGAVMGYEALGRAIAGNLTVNTAELFSLAEICQSASELSRVFRQEAMREAVTIPGHFHLFINIHPVELLETCFLGRLQEQLSVLPERCQVVLEIHEDTLVDCTAMRCLHEQVRKLGLLIAYDDFGAGQARLADLAEVPPDFIKLDMKLLRNIDKSPPRQELVRALCQMALPQGITMLAEGLETTEEVETCQSLGCELGQGYFFGRPQSASLMSKPQETREINRKAVLEELARRQA